MTTYTVEGFGETMRLPPLRDGDVIHLTRPGSRGHNVLVGVAGFLQCDCRAAHNGLECWALKQVRNDMSENQTTALVPIKVAPPAALPTREEIQIIAILAKNAANTAGVAIPKEINTADKAFAVMVAGHELGIKPMTALRHIFLVNGRPEPSAQIMAGIVTAKEPAARFDVLELNYDRCRMRFTRPDHGPNAVWEYTYELKDAEKAGLLGGGNWRKYPKDMLRWACTKRLCRAFAPDLINAVVGGTSFVDEPEVEPVETIEGLVRLDDPTLYNDDDDPREPPPGVDPDTGEVLDAAAYEASQDDGSSFSAANEADKQEPPQAEGRSVEELRDEIERLLLDCHQTWGPREYGAFIRQIIGHYMPPEAGGKFEKGRLTYDAALDLIAEVRRRRGEPA